MTTEVVKPRIVLTAVDETRAAFASVQKNMGSLQEAAQSLPGKFGSIGAAIAGAFSAVTLASMVEVLDQMDAMAERTGQSVKTLSELRYAAELSDTNLESLAKGIRHLSTNMVENESKFALLGVQIRDTTGQLRDQRDVLFDVADKFSGYSDGAARTAAAIELFGRSGEELVGFLSQGSEGIQELIDQGRELGAALSNDAARGAAEFNDHLTRQRLLLEGAKALILRDVLPTVNTLAAAYLEASKRSSDFSLAGETIATVLESVAVTAVNVVYVLKAMGTEIGGLSAQAVALAKLDFSAVAAIREAMVEDARLARQDVDRLSERILSVRTQAQQIREQGQRNEFAAIDPRRLDLRAKSDAPALGGKEGAAKDTDPTKTGIYRQALKDAEDRQKRRIDEDKAIADMLRDRYVSAQQAASKLLETQRSQLEELRFEASLVGATNQERERAVLIRQNELALQQALIDATEQDRDALRQRNAELLNEQLLALEKKQRLEIHAQVAEEERQAAIQRTRTIADSIEEGILRGSRAGLSIMDILRQELVAQWSRTVLRPLINPIAQAGNDILGGVFKSGMLDSITMPGGGFGGGVSLGQVLQGGFGTGNRFGNEDFGLFLAEGGRPPMGKVSIVGERGPEMFVPDRPGTIIPNHKLGGTTVVVSPTIHIDSRADAAQVEASVRRAIDQSQRELLDTLERQGRL